MSKQLDLLENAGLGAMFSTVLFNGIYDDAKEIAVAWPWTPKRSLTYLNNKQAWMLPNEPDITHSNPNTLLIS